MWMERNARNFEEKEMGPFDIFEKEKFLESLWAASDKAFKRISILFDHFELERCDRKLI